MSDTKPQHGVVAEELCGCRTEEMTQQIDSYDWDVVA